MINGIKISSPWESRELFYFNELGENRAIGGPQGCEELRRLLREDYEGFWEAVGKGIDWFSPWEKVIEGGIPGDPEFKFFAGGYSNVCYNMLDRHIKKGNGNKLALIWENENGDKVEFYTYNMLYTEVCKFSNALKEVGLRKGDRMAIFMPNSPAAAIAIMSAYRLGLVFTPLFTGLTHDALVARLKSFEPMVVVTMDGSYRRGTVLPLKTIIDEMLNEAPSVNKVIVKKYVDNEIQMMPGRDIWWDDFTACQSPECPAVPVEANEIQYVLYTSGTSGVPKGSSQAGVGMAAQTCFIGKVESALDDRDVYYSLADIGWAGSEAHAVLAGWTNGVTIVWQEGAGFTIPSLERFYQTIEKYRVNKAHLAPTVLRMLMALGKDAPSKYDLSSLKLLLSMGEPMSADLWKWIVDNVGNGELYLGNAWAMTELGSCFGMPCAFVDPLKPGAVCRQDSVAWGLNIDVVDDKGKSLPVNARGNVVVKRPSPGMAHTLWREHDRYLGDYYGSPKGMWSCNDEGVFDEDGYLWIIGRTDDVINVAGHRLDTSELEGAVNKVSRYVQASAVIGIPDPIKEQVPVAFVHLKPGVKESDAIRDEINKEVIDSIGKYAQLHEVIFVEALPTTISGKIMRRLIKDIRIYGDIKGDATTLEDRQSIGFLKKAMEKVQK